MANIQIIQGDFEKKLKLQFAPGIRAGFPSPAEDYNHDTLDFNRDLIRNPEATFYGKVEGDSMIEAGINDGDIAVIDRSLEPRDGDIVVGYINEEFTIKYLDLSHRNDGYIELRPANKDFKPIRIDEDGAGQAHQPFNHRLRAGLRADDGYGRGAGVGFLLVRISGERRSGEC